MKSAVCPPRRDAEAPASGARRGRRRRAAVRGASFAWRVLGALGLGATLAGPVAAAAAPAATAVAPVAPVESLSGTLAVPVAGVARSALVDSYHQRRGARPHEAIDIVASRGTPVFAVADGTLTKLFRSVPGGLTVYQLDASGSYFFYYAHLDRYAPGLQEGAALRRCQLIGYVGSSGNARADAPHLHFAVFKANAKHQWWRGTPLNPFTALAGASAAARTAATADPAAPAC